MKLLRLNSPKCVLLVSSPDTIDKVTAGNAVGEIGCLDPRWRRAAKSAQYLEAGFTSSPWHNQLHGKWQMASGKWIEKKKNNQWAWYLGYN